MDLFIVVLLCLTPTVEVRQVDSVNDCDKRLHSGGIDVRKPRSADRDDISVSNHGETKYFMEFLRHIQYDHRQRPEPFHAGHPAVIGVSMFISSIRSVSEITMDYSLELFFREYWIDPRLDWDPRVFGNKSELVLHSSYSEFLWHADTFFPNAISSKNPEDDSITHRSLIRLGRGGKSLYSRRLSVVVECPMDLTLFPFDRQVCKLSIESYGYQGTDVIYKWMGEDAVQKGNIRLPDFKLEHVFTTARNASYETGTYSRLYCCFVFARSSGFCLLQLIVPASSAVVISWVSLWMEKDTSFQDMISIVLTVTFLIFSYNSVMPRVSYIKAMDVYLGTCFFLVFITLIKLVLVKFLRLKFDVITKQAGPISFDAVFDKKIFCCISRSILAKINTASRIIFPSGFILFSLFFFLGYQHLFPTVIDEDCDVAA